MDSLIAVGASAAVIYGIIAPVFYRLGPGPWGLWQPVERYSMDLYFESAAMIVTLITVGKYLETRSKGKTGQAIARLMDLSPKTATVLRDGVEAESPGGAGPGRRSGAGASRSHRCRWTAWWWKAVPSVDESALTGESHSRGQGAGGHGHFRDHQPVRRSDAARHPGGRRHDAGADDPPGGRSCHAPKRPSPSWRIRWPESLSR